MRLEAGRERPEFALMRTLFLALPLLLAACGEKDGAKEETVASQASSPITYEAGGRDRLCIDPNANRAGLIVYAGQGDANCSVQGASARSGNRLVLTPDGDSSCRIEAQEQDGVIVFGPLSPACAYYCGPGASYAGKSFRMTKQPQRVTDLGGDPLC